MQRVTRGFTLIEVLLAVAIFAIAITAMVSITSKSIYNTHRLKDKTIGHWVAQQGITMIQLGLLPVNLNQTVSQVTLMLGERWYWQAKVSRSPIKGVQKIIVTRSLNPSGPFVAPLIGWRHEE